MGRKEVSRKHSWWHHGPHSYETKGSFGRRADRFKQWLSTLRIELNVSHAVVISHGGFLKQAFNFNHAPNCGFMVVDVHPDASVTHLLTGEHIPHSFQHHPEGFEVVAAVQLEDHYEVDMRLEGSECRVLCPFDDLYTQIFRKVKRSLPKDIYKKFMLDKKWPNNLLGDGNESLFSSPKDVQDYLQQLSCVVSEPDFPADLTEEIIEFFMTRSNRVELEQMLEQK